MPQNDRRSLWSAIRAAGNSSRRFLWGGDATVTLADLARGSSLSVGSEELGSRSVLVATSDQLTAALALIELDGIARRLVLYPPDLPLEKIPLVIASAGVDAIVSDREGLGPNTSLDRPVITVSPAIVPADSNRKVLHPTEWVLFTSGTTGLPKMVVHTLSSLAGAIDSHAASTDPVWSTFYDIRRYGGLQIFLRTMLTTGSLVLSGAQESTADFLIRAGAHGVTHISGTPSHWRRALMSPAAHRIAPQYVRLSGEIADQVILDHLRSFYAPARVAHAFASTEAGVAFDVSDGFAGFPASLIEAPGTHVEMKVQDGSLWIRSTRTASRYLGSQAETLTDAEGFIDTRDMLELRGDRYYFVGRRDGIVNVGGLKVHPEEVEAVINRHPQVRMSLVRTRRNPITGALVVADVVLETAEQPADSPAGEVEHDILRHCRQMLPRHKVPASIRFVGSLAVSPTGKLVRRYA